MIYLAEQKTYITEKGNSMSEAEVYYRDFARKARQNALPYYDDKGSHQPALSDPRTYEILEQLIDLVATDSEASNG